MGSMNLHDVARLPSPADNCAIATKILDAGTTIEFDGAAFALSHTVLVGHRFAIRPISPTAYLTSWGFPFGRAIRPISPGQYVCNDNMLRELGSRHLDFALPSSANFADEIPAFNGEYNIAPPTGVVENPNTFLGYPRDGGRGAGTRNYIILVTTSSLSNGLVEQVEAQFKSTTEQYDQVDGVVAVAHTEGHSADANNYQLTLRTLAGFIVHPNVGAALIVDDGSGHDQRLIEFMQANGYPLGSVLHQTLGKSGSFSADLQTASDIVRSWLPIVNRNKRTEVPFNNLKVALQCGGSDAFSGVSGNPLAAWVAREIIRHGGSANLAETDELVGAEAYVLDKVKDAATAARFVEVVERYKTWAGWHGHSVQSNPSGGNLYRGLYNIYLKSLGAAAKRDPEVRLDAVIDYAQPMTAAGFHFMDSPGNDLESIAGQVAAGSNLIFFVTGNGSITNFPFVPTIKIVTTTPRFELLQSDMDVNAGAYLDGTPLDEVGRDTFAYTKQVASGKRSVGEQAGHSQVQLWRNWRLSQAMDQLDIPINRPVTDSPLKVSKASSPSPSRVEGDQFLPPRGRLGGGSSVNMILPTSLCSGQIARMLVAKLNQRTGGYMPTVTLPHTEGCGSPTQPEFIQTMIGYATHPMVNRVLMLEHGCEMTHNAFWRNQFVGAGLEPSDFGWASIQLDGGIERVSAKMVAWFEGANDRATVFDGEQSTESRAVALLSHDQPSEQAARTLATLIQQIASDDGQIVIAEHDPLLQNSTFCQQLGIDPTPAATMRFAAQPKGTGLHIMQTPSADWLETITGLGATGVGLMISAVERPMPGHIFVPLLQGSQKADLEADFVLDGSFGVEGLRVLIGRTLAGEYRPIATQQNNVGFQITRGSLGISL